MRKVFLVQPSQQLQQPRHFVSFSLPLNATNSETVTRVAAVQAVNLELETISAWGSGRFTADAETSDPEVRAMVIEASRSRVVLVWRSVQGVKLWPGITVVTFHDTNNS